MDKSTDRRDAILQAAAELIAEQGITETNVRQIALRAGISNGTLHYYFPSKDELIDELILKAVAPLQHRTWEIVQGDGLPRELLTELVGQTFALFDASWNLYHVALLLGDHLRARKPAEFPSATGALEELVRRGQQAGLVRHGDPLMLAILCHGMILRVQRARTFGELAPPLSQYADHVVEACWRVLAADRPDRTPPQSLSPQEPQL